MNQNLYRWCLVCFMSIALDYSAPGITAVEVLKSSEFEDKEIPLLLNWKGDKHESNRKKCDNWWRLISDEEGKTDEYLREPDSKNQHSLEFKRSLKPFNPDILPLRSLLKRRLRRNHTDEKRWISSSFGFGNKKKNRKGSKQLPNDSSAGLVKSIPTPTVVNSWGEYAKEGAAGIGNGENGFNGIQKTLSQQGNDPPALSANHVGDRYDAQSNKYPSKLSELDEWVSSRGVQNKLQNVPNDKSNRWFGMHSKKKEPIQKKVDHSRNRSLSLVYPARISQSKSLSNSLYTGKPTVGRKVWNRYPTETVFDRVLEPFTELRYNPLKFRFTLDPLHPTTSIYEPKLPKKVAIRPGAVHSNNTVGAHQNINESSPEIEVIYDMEPSVPPSKSEMAKRILSDPADVIAARGKSSQEEFDISSIKDSSQSFYAVGLHGNGNINGVRTKSFLGPYYRSSTVPYDSFVSSNNRKYLSSDEKLNDAIFSKINKGGSEPFIKEVESPSNIQQKIIKSKSRMPFVSCQPRNSLYEGGKYIDNYNCGGGGGNPYCGGIGNPYCGGGVNISILMPSAAAAPIATESTSMAPLSADKHKKKKDKKMKIQNSAEISSFQISRMDGSPLQRPWSYRDADDNTFLVSKNPIHIDAPRRLEKSTPSNAFVGISKTNVDDSRPFAIPDPAKMIWSGYPNNIFKTTWPSFDKFVPMSATPPLLNVSGLGSDFGQHTMEEEEDDDDEIRELYDEQSNNKNAIPTNTNSYVKNSLAVKNANGSGSPAIGRMSYIERLKNTPDRQKASHVRDKLLFPSNKKPKIAPLNIHSKFEEIVDHWEKYKFPRRKIDSKLKEDFYSLGESKLKKRYSNENTESFRTPFKHRYFQTMRNSEQHESYDQWESLDEDLKNDLTGGRQEPFKLLLRNKKREVDTEESAGDEQGYFRLSSGNSLRHHPANYIISAFRKGKNDNDIEIGNGLEESSADVNQSSAKPNAMKEHQGSESSRIIGQKDEEIESKVG